MTTFVRSSLAVLLALPAISCAQDKTGPERNRVQSEQRQPMPGDVHRAQDRHPDADKAEGGVHGTRRLESVTWNSVKHELTWVISKGEKNGAAYKALSSLNYEIKMDDATMTFNGQSRRFSKEEAANVHVLMDLVSKYAVDSTVWWDQGHGEPADGKKRPENESVAVLHVAARPTPVSALSPEALQQRIDLLESKLAELKELQKTAATAGPVQLTSY